MLLISTRMVIFRLRFIFQIDNEIFIVFLVTSFVGGIEYGCPPVRDFWKIRSSTDIVVFLVLIVLPLLAHAPLVVAPFIFSQASRRRTAFVTRHLSEEET